MRHMEEWGMGADIAAAPAPAVAAEPVQMRQKKEEKGGEKKSNRLSFFGRKKKDKDG